MNQESSNYDLEDLIYDEFFEALDSSHTYDKDDFLTVFNVAEGYDPFSQHQAGQDQVFEGALALEGYNGKAAYAVVEDHGEQVDVDIKKLGDLDPVFEYVRDQPPEGLAENMDTINGDAFVGAAARASEHVMNVDTQTSIPQPGSSPERGFTNGQAERIRQTVLED